VISDKDSPDLWMDCM